MVFSLFPACIFLKRTYSENKLDLLHLYIRSFQKHIEDLHDIFFLPRKPHVICISETKIKHSPNLNITILGYSFLYKIVGQTLVAVVFTVTIHCNMKKMTSKYDLLFSESFRIQIKFSSNSINYIVRAVYLYPYSNKNYFIESLNGIILNLNKCKSYYVIGGSININTSFKTSS